MRAKWILLFLSACAADRGGFATPSEDASLPSDATTEDVGPEDAGPSDGGPPDVGLDACTTEICNGVDDDCDGATDEGVSLTTYYPDADGDGYGDDSVDPTEGCTPPVGYSETGGDCDDDRDDVHPDATEVCNEIDDDCDETTDEGVTTTYYRDNDHDGYGTDDGRFDHQQEACAPPDDYVANDDDCNDGDATKHWLTFGADEDGDYFYPDGAATMRFCQAAGTPPPDGWGAVGGDCDDDDASVNPFAYDDCGGRVDRDCDGSVDMTLCMHACNEAPIGGSIYHFCRGAATWPEAESFCAGLGGHLVELGTRAEDDTVFAFTKVFELWYPWIGLNDRAMEDDFEWSTGAPLGSDTHWKGGEPNDGGGGGNEDCVQLLTDGRWNDTPCTDTLPFVCERAP